MRGEHVWRHDPIRNMSHLILAPFPAQCTGVSGFRQWLGNTTIYPAAILRWSRDYSSILSIIIANTLSLDSPAAAVFTLQCSSAAPYRPDKTL